MVAENVKVTYTQDWKAYDAAQCAEKETFMPMLADLSLPRLPTLPKVEGVPACR